MTEYQTFNTLDIEQPAALTDYLRRTGRIDDNEMPRITVLAGGISNRTVLVERQNGDAWVLKQALAKLRVKVDWFSSPERILHETQGLRWLTRLTPPGTVPALIFEDSVNYVLAMQAIPQPHANWKTLLLNGNLRINHVTQFGELLGTIQARSSEQRDEIASLFADWSFFESLRIEPYYSYTATQIPEVAAFIDSLIADTRQTHLALVHGDYSPKNILVHQDRLILLDHEVIHFGDPAFDVGFSMTHLLSKAHHLPARRHDFADAACHYWETYRTALGSTPWLDDAYEARSVRHTLACLLARVAGRSQLEYMSDVEKANQQRVVVKLIAEPPRQMPDLITRFTANLGA